MDPPPPPGRPEVAGAEGGTLRFIAAGVEEPDEAGTMVGNSEDMVGEDVVRKSLEEKGVG